MTRENNPEDFNLDEVCDETEDDDDEFRYQSLLESAREFPEIPIFPLESLLFPLERMTIEVSDETWQKVFAGVLEAEGLVGFAYQPKGRQTLPPIGTLGVAAVVSEIIKTDFGKIHLVKLWGMARFEIDGYVETGKPVPMAKVSYFQDDDLKMDHPRLIALKIEELRGQLRQWLALSNKPNKNLAENLPDTVTVELAEMYSFFFWRWVNLQPDVRLAILGLRSTFQRLFVLSHQFEVGINELKDRYRADNN